MKRTKTIEIVWHDAIIFQGTPPARLSLEVTEGVFVKEDGGFVIVKNPRTKKFRRSAGRFVADRRKPTYFFIPRGMIERIGKRGG